MLKLVNASKLYTDNISPTTALDGVNLQIESGEYVAVTGPSGCGKSTLLGLLGLLDSPTSGKLWFEGRDVTDAGEAERSRLRRGRIGFIFQNFNLIEEMSVAANIELALTYVESSALQRRRRTDEILERLGIAHRAGFKPSQLSGGEQQRAAIARALVVRPALLLADEPTGNLDSRRGNEVMRILRDIHAEGTTVVMVTHSAQHAAQATRALQLHDGRVLVDATHPL